VWAFLVNRLTADDTIAAPIRPLCRGWTLPALSPTSTTLTSPLAMALPRSGLDGWQNAAGPRDVDWLPRGN